MKKDLVTVVIAAVAGFAMAYFVTNLLYPTIEAVQVKTLGETINSSLSMPSDDVFNFRSINPTVEVYVGQCKEYNANGDCIDSANDTDDELSEDDKDAENGENNIDSPTEPLEESGNGDSN